MQGFLNFTQSLKSQLCLLAFSLSSARQNVNVNTLYMLGLFIWMYFSFMCSVLSHLLVHFQVQPAVYVCVFIYVCVYLWVFTVQGGRK